MVRNSALALESCLFVTTFIEKSFICYNFPLPVVKRNLCDGNAEVGMHTGFIEYIVRPISASHRCFSKFDNFNLMKLAKVLWIDVIPLTLFHMIYFGSDKRYPCIVGIGLN